MEFQETLQFLNELGISLNNEDFTLNVSLQQFYSNLQQKVEEDQKKNFSNHISKYLEEIWNKSIKCFQKCLVPLSSGLDDVQTSLPPLIHLLLTVSFIQEDLSQTIINYFESLITTDPEQATCLAAPIFSQFSWLPVVCDGSALLRRLMSIFNSLDSNCKKSLLLCLPEIFTEQYHHDIATVLFDLLESSCCDIPETAIQVLSQFNISDSLKLKLCNFAVSRIHQSNSEQCFILAKFIFKTVSKELAPVPILMSFRTALLIKINMEDITFSDTLYDLFKEFESCLRRDHIFLSYWAEIINDELEEVAEIDMVLFLLIVKNNMKKSPIVEYLSRCMHLPNQEEILKTALSHNKRIIEENLSTLVQIFATQICDKSKFYFLPSVSILKVFTEIFKSSNAPFIIMNTLLSNIQSSGITSQKYQAAEALLLLSQSMSNIEMADMIQDVLQINAPLPIFHMLFKSWFNIVQNSSDCAESFNKKVIDFIELTIVSMNKVSPHEQDASLNCFCSLLHQLAQISNSKYELKISNENAVASLFRLLVQSGVALCKKIKLIRNINTYNLNQKTDENNKENNFQEIFQNKLSEEISKLLDDLSFTSITEKLPEFHIKNFSNFLSLDKLEARLKISLLPTLISCIRKRSSKNSSISLLARIVKNLEEFSNLLCDSEDLALLRATSFCRWVECIGVEVFNVLCHMDESAENYKLSCFKALFNIITKNKNGSSQRNTKPASSRKRKITKLESKNENDECLNVTCEEKLQEDSSSIPNRDDNLITYFDNILENRTHGPSILKPRSIFNITTLMLSSYKVNSGEFIVRFSDILTEEIKKTVGEIKSIMVESSYSYHFEEFSQLIPLLTDLLYSEWKNSSDQSDELIMHAINKENLDDLQLNITPIDDSLDLSELENLSLSIISLLVSLESALCLKIETSLTALDHYFTTNKCFLTWFRVSLQSASSKCTFALFKLLNTKNIRKINSNLEPYTAYEKLISINLKYRNWSKTTSSSTVLSLVQMLLKIYLRPSTFETVDGNFSSTIDKYLIRIQEIFSVLLEFHKENSELSSSTVVSSQTGLSETSRTEYSIILKSTIPSLYNVLLDACLNIFTVSTENIGDANINSSFEYFDQLMEMFAKLFRLIQQYDHRENVRICIKAGVHLTNLLLLKWIPFMNNVVMSNTNKVIESLCASQKCTRFLQTVCSHAKSSYDQRITNEIPSLKKVLEEFICRVQQMCMSHGIISLFELGNLKTRNIYGQEVLSQLTQS